MYASHFLNGNMRNVIKLKKIRVKYEKLAQLIIFSILHEKKRWNMKYLNKILIILK